MCARRKFDKSPSAAAVAEAQMIWDESELMEVPITSGVHMGRAETDCSVAVRPHQRNAIGCAIPDNRGRGDGKSTKENQ